MNTQAAPIPQSLADWLNQIPVALNPPPPNWENTPESKAAQITIAETLPDEIFSRN